jgi:hypothetical protein
MLQHVERLRTKPLHVRRNIAVGVSTGVTALIAVAWFGTLAATGAFSLAPQPQQANSVVANAPDIKQAVASAKTNFSDLLGAAGAASSTSTPATGLTIVETASSTSLDSSAQAGQDQTDIQF